MTNNEQKYKAGDRFRFLDRMGKLKNVVLEYIEDGEDDEEGVFNVIEPKDHGGTFTTFFSALERIPTTTENPILGIIEQVDRLEVASENAWIKATVLLMLDKLKELNK